jgi:hypothetical protein
MSDFRVVRKQAPTTNTTQDFTVSGFGTPDAAIIISAGINSDSLAAHMSPSLCVWDGGTSEAQLMMYSADNDATVNYSRGRRSSATLCLQYNTTGATSLRTATCAATTDGIQLTWAVATDPATHRPWVTVLLIKGVTATAYGEFDPPQDATSVADSPADTITTTGVNPNLIFFFYAGQLFPNSSGTGYHPSWGFAYDNGVTIDHRCMGFKSTSSESPVATGCYFDDTNCVMAWAGTATTSRGELFVDSMGSGSFDVKERALGGKSGFISGTEVGYVALEMEDACEVFTTTLPTTSGDWNLATGLSIVPQAVFLMNTFVTANTDSEGAYLGGTFYVADDQSNDNSDKEGGVAFHEENNVTTTNTGTDGISSYKSYSDDGTLDLTASSPVFGNNSIKFLDANVDTASQATRVFGLAFGGGTATTNAIVKSVERVTIDWDATSEPVTQNLSKNQAETQCVPFFTKRLVSGSLTDDFRERTMKVEMIDNGGTPAVRVSASGKTSANDHRIEVYVVEFESTITVQQVDADIADTNGSANITISDVGAQTSAFFLYSYQYTHASAQDRPDYACVRPIWNGASTTSVTIERTGTTGAIDGMLYVVSCASSEFSVQHRDISVAATDELTNDTITAVPMATSFLLTHFRSSEAEDDPLDWSFVADLSTTTNVRVRRSIAGASNATGNVGVQVVTALGGEWSVLRGDLTTTSSLSQTTVISAVDLTRAFVKTGTHEAGLNSLGTSDLAAGTIIDEVGPSAYLSANNTITWTRESVSETGNTIPWEVIQFSAGLDNPILIPTGPLR